MATSQTQPQDECAICRKRYRSSQLSLGELIQPGVFEALQAKHPDFSASSLVCPTCLNQARSDYVLDVLKEEEEKISTLEKEVAQSLEDQELISEDIYKEYEEQLSFGERLADKMAEFGGSWGFIVIFFSFIIVWIGINTYLLLTAERFDPYPYILLNLVLSCLAAVQAPVIMMSQNRQESRDRLRSQHDYQVNLKAELEIRQLHGKIDLILKNQWRRLMEIQKMQLDIMQELRKR